MEQGQKYFHVYCRSRDTSFFLGAWDLTTRVTRRKGRRLIVWHRSGNFFRCLWRSAETTTVSVNIVRLMRVLYCSEEGVHFSSLCRINLLNMELKCSAWLIIGCLIHHKWKYMPESNRKVHTNWVFSSRCSKKTYSTYFTHGQKRYIW